MNSYKTTVTGILMLITLLTGATTEYLQHDKLPNLALLLPQIMAAIGLIMAKDANVSNAPTPLPVSKVVAIVGLGFVLAFAMTGCATDPKTGKKVYVGPALTIGASYEGVSGNVKIEPTYAKDK